MGEIGDRTYALMVDRIAALETERDKLRKAAENVTLTAEARYTVGGRDHGKQVYSVVMKVYLDELRAALAKEGE